MIISNEQKKAAEQITSTTTMIGTGTTIDGNIDTTGNIRVEGVVLGSVSSKAKVAVGNGSKVQGSIRAQHADIEGEVRGNIEIGELLTLKKTAVINGDIVTNKLVIELGAFFNGKCVMGAASKNIKIADAGKGFFSLSEATRKL
jgi:cytoskeletal protein CcmA (bactofilin family)